MDFLAGGMGTSYWNDVLAPEFPWHRALVPKGMSGGDPRLFPIRGGGRELRHPFLPRIVYPRVPDKTFNFGYDLLRKTRSLVTKTIDSTTVTKFKDAIEDVVIREVWLADQLSTFTKFFHALQSFISSVIPPFRYVGWVPRDLTAKCYFVELLDVSVGGVDDYLIEEIGKTPYMMRESLTLSFKPIREIFPPSGVVIGVGL